MDPEGDLGGCGKVVCVVCWGDADSVSRAAEVDRKSAKVDIGVEGGIFGGGDSCGGVVCFSFPPYFLVPACFSLPLRTMLTRRSPTLDMQQLATHASDITADDIAISVVAEVASRTSSLTISRTHLSNPLQSTPAAGLNTQPKPSSTQAHSPSVANPSPTGALSQD